MTMISNREIGNAWISYVLGELYDDWPRKRDFDHLQLASQTGISPVRESEQLFDDLIEWLAAEGYIRRPEQALPEGCAVDIALTEKGYLVLGSMPDSLSEPLGRRLKQAAMTAGSSAGKEAIAGLVGQTIGAAAKAFSGT